MSSSAEYTGTFTRLRQRRPEWLGFRFALGAMLLPFVLLFVGSTILGGGGPLAAWVTILFVVVLEGMLLAGGRVKARWVLALLICAVAWLALRAFLADRNRRVDVVTMPAKTKSWPSILVDEHDGVVPTAAVLVGGAFIPPIEREELVGLLSDGYSRMENDVGPAPTPAVPTWTGRVSWQRWELLTIEPKTNATVGAVVFLHGTGGNFTLPCWQVSEAAARAGYLTLCPSTSVRARWADPAGRRVVEETLDEARRRVPKGPLVLAGLSSGGEGASRLAASLKDRIDGLLLVSGLEASAQPINKPTLVIQGRLDRMMPPQTARDWAKSAEATYLELQGNHFVFLKRHDEIEPVLLDWLGRLRLPQNKTP